MADITLEQAKQILGDRAMFELQHMVRALSFARFLNDEDDEKRLQAAKVLLKDKRTKQRKR